MRKLLGAIGLHRGKVQPVPVFDEPARAPRRSLEARHTGTPRLSVVTVVSDLQSELRLRRRGPTARAAPGFDIRTDTPQAAFPDPAEHL